MHGHALEHFIANVMAKAVVDLLEVVDVDHRQVLPGRGVLQLALGLGHERAAVGDLGQHVDIRLVQQHLGHVEVVQLGLADAQVAVDHQAAEEHRIAEQHGGFEVVQVDVGAEERVEHGPGNGHGTEERPAPHRQYRHAVQHG
ncbi:hypothetical protein D3C76_1331720 [compost metagenome]